MLNTHIYAKVTLQKLHKGAILVIATIIFFAMIFPIYYKTYFCIMITYYSLVEEGSKFWDSHFSTA